jgi:hypothetical protein
MEYTVRTALGDLFVVDRATLSRPVSSGNTVWLSLADQGVTVVPS